MKKYLLSGILLSFGLQLAAQKLPAEPYTTHKFPGLVGNVTVETNGGNITVIGTASAGATVEVYITPNGGRGKTILTREEIKQKLESDYDMNVSYANNKITAIAKHKKTNERDWWQDALNISFRIYVPETVATDLRTSGGN
ncbi:MAG: hypothetical protein JWQ78_1805, partial [Sediminibacterium sp.]|nr:hypothetical protein [Sediminibacterium sp.]